MKPKKGPVLVLFVVACLFLLLFEHSCPGAIPRTLNYQGRLTDTVGNVIITAKKLQFKIYSAISGGGPVWTSGFYTVIPDKNGVFSVSIGSNGDPISPVVFSDAARYIEISIDDEAMTPRVLFNSVAYAFKASDSDSLAGYPGSEYLRASGGTITSNLTVEGIVAATSFAGDGSQLTGISSTTGVTSIAKQGQARIIGSFDLKEGSNITLTQTGQTIEVSASGGSGSVKYDDITIGLNASSSLEVKDLGITASKLASDAAVISISSSDAAALKGNVNLKAGSNVTITQTGQTIEVSAASGGGSGTVTQVNTGTGLTGGPITATGTVSIAAGGVSTNEVADGAITNAKLAGSISEDKLDNISAAGKVSGSAITLGTIAGTTNFNSSGKVTAEAFYGIGTGLTGIVATSAITSETSGRADYAATLASDAAVISISSADATALKGNVNLKAGPNVTITQTGQTIEVSAASGGGGGTVTQVNTGTGLTGGPINTSGTISIAAGGVSSSEISANAVTSEKISAEAVTAGKLAPDININTTGTGSFGALSVTGNISKINNVPYAWPASAPSGKYLKTSDGSGTLTWEAAGGGGGTPGGADKQVQFNNGGSFGGNDKFNWSNADNRLGIGTDTPSASLEVTGGAIKATGGLIIETRADDPPSPVTGQMWLRTDL